MKKLVFWALLCAAGAWANIGLSVFSQNVISLPLFMDTLWTVSLTLYGGVWVGAFTGALTNIFSSLLYGSTAYLYAVVNVAVAVLTAVVVRFFPDEFASVSLAPSVRQRRPVIVERIIALLALSLVHCIAVSVLGGLISTLILRSSPEYYAGKIEGMTYDLSLSRLVYVRYGLPTVLVEILARLPINIIDRLITTFGAYGFALLLRRLPFSEALSPGRKP